MNKRGFSLLATAVILVLFLSACTLSASKAPEVTPTAEGAFPFPVETQDLIADLMTQTAMASGEGPKAATTPEPEVEAEPTETPEPEIAAVIPTLERPKSYTLKKGEWPICIARRFDLNVASLLSLNGLGMDSKPGVGTVLNIPQSGSWDSGARALKSHPTDYTVKAGDTVYTIACAFGDVSPEGIAAANGLESPYTLTAGNTLKIP